MSTGYSTQNDEILNHVLKFYNKENRLQDMLNIINGESRVSLRIVDWFSTNYAKKFFTVYPIEKNGETIRFKVYQDYKLRLKAYSKKRFDPFADGIVLIFLTKMEIIFKQQLDSSIFLNGPLKIK